MTPDQILIMTSLIGLIEKVSGWPFGLMLFLFIVGPWVLAMLLGHQQGKRIEAAVRMYENNVVLVENYKELAKDLHDVVVMNTQAMTGLRDDIQQNQFCPMVRLEKKAGGKQL